jgi:F-type H+-transporting ATPase subunit b
MEILNQIGELVLGSVPTMLLFVLLVALYGVLVRRPLDKTLAERRARTKGAVEQARGAIAAAEAETTVFEDKLRSARSEIMAMREGKMKQWQAERDAVLLTVRSSAQEKVRGARKDIDESAQRARLQIEQAVEQLSEQVLRAVLPQGAGSTEVRPS